MGVEVSPACEAVPDTSGKALARWRRARCVELALAGHSYDEIAQAVGYQSRGTAWRAVQDSLMERRSRAGEARLGD